MTIDREKIEFKLNKLGFNDYKWINPGDIVVAHWVRVKCTFGCADYGLATCPPNTPNVEDCEQFFKEFYSGIIIRLTVKADKKAYPSAWSKKNTKNLLELEKEVFLMNHPKAFLLNQTCCGICKECTKTRIDCIDKTNARPSPEAFAVDVYQTLHNLGMEINVIEKSTSVINRVAILLIE